MEQIVPGIWHWTALHPSIKITVHSYYLEDEGVLIDPITPDDGLDWFAEHGPPSDVLLTNRHHYRSTGEFVERFGVAVRCVRPGLHEFARGEPSSLSTSATSCREGSSPTKSEPSARTRPRSSSPVTMLSRSRTEPSAGSLAGHSGSSRIT